MTVQKMTVQKNLVILDSVSFSIDLTRSSAASIRQHPDGPCFSCGSALAILSEQQALELINAGVTDCR